LRSIVLWVIAYLVERAIGRSILNRSFAAEQQMSLLRDHYLGAMRTTCCLLFFLVVLTTSAQVPLDVAVVDLPEKLVGVWEGPLGEGRYREVWTQVTVNTYEGVARMIQGEKVLSEEQMRLTFFAGQWLLIASTGDTRITSFVRVEVKDGVWVFENKEHDFPQRIGYHVEGDVLRAYIAGSDDQAQRMDFLLQRVR